MADDPNLYSYCGQNPVNRVDPTGNASAGFDFNFSFNAVGGALNVVASKNEDFGNAMSAFGMLSDLAKIPAINNILQKCGFNINNKKPKVEQKKSTNSGVSADKVNAAFSKLPEKADGSGTIDLTKINHKKIMEVANDAGLNDSERLYLATLVAYQNPNYDKVKVGRNADGTDKFDTYCNAFAADVLYLWSGSTELMASDATPEKYGNFVEKGNWIIITATDKPGVQDQKKVLNNDKKFKNLGNDAHKAQDSANVGKFVVGFDDGHIAVVVAGEGYIRDSIFYPYAAQQGSNKFVNGVYTTITYRNGYTDEGKKMVVTEQLGKRHFKNTILRIYEMRDTNADSKNTRVIVGDFPSNKFNKNCFWPRENKA